MFVIGGARSFGVIFVHLTEFFDASSASAAWSVGLLTFGMSFYGPLAGYVSRRYSFRVTTMIGGAAQGLSFVVSAFAPNVYFVSMMIGIVDGFADGFLYTTAVSAVSQYFLKRRSLAVGMAVAGSSVGQFVLPQLMRFLLDHYGYFGCMLIYGAFSWNSLVAAALYRPVSFYERRGKVGVSGRTSIDDRERVGDKMAECRTTTNKTKQSEDGQSNETRGNNTTDSKVIAETEICSNISETFMNAEISEILSPGSMSMLYDPDELGSSKNQANNLAKDQAKSSRRKETFRRISKILDLSFMRHPNFWFYTAAIFLANPALLNIVLFIPSYAKEIHLNKKQASLMLSVGGICDFVGKLAAGAFASLRLVRVRHLLTTVMLLLFVVLMLGLAFPSFAVLMVMVTTLGTCAGIFVAMHPVFLLEIFPNDRFTMAYACAVGIHSISALILPLVGGAIADATGSFKIPYWMCLTMVAVAAILFQMQPVGDKIYRKREMKKSQQTTAVL